MKIFPKKNLFCIRQGSSDPDMLEIWIGDNSIGCSMFYMSCDVSDGTVGIELIKAIIQLTNEGYTLVPF